MAAATGSTNPKTRSHKIQDSSGGPIRVGRTEGADEPRWCVAGQCARLSTSATSGNFAPSGVGRRGRSPGAPRPRCTRRRRSGPETPALPAPPDHRSAMGRGVKECGRRGPVPRLPRGARTGVSSPATATCAGFGVGDAWDVVPGGRWLAPLPQPLLHLPMEAEGRPDPGCRGAAGPGWAPQRERRALGRRSARVEGPAGRVSAGAWGCGW